jgi:hypothetical protein
MTTKIPYTLLADGTAGQLITWGASGTTAAVAAGTTGQVLTSNGAGAAPTFQSGGGGGDSFGTKLLHLQDQKPSGTNGGSLASGSWVTRTLNTEVTDEIGSTLSADTFTLPAGTYFITARTPGRGSDPHQCRLFNVTDAAAVLYGATEQSNTTSTSVSSSVLRGRFVIAGTKTFRLEHRVTAGLANGGGEETSFGNINIYSEVLVWKVA